MSLEKKIVNMSLEFNMSLEKKIVLSCPWKKKCLFEIDGPSLDLLAAGHCENLAINSQSSPLALQFLVQQRHFMSSIEQVSVVPQADPSYERYFARNQLHN